MVGDGWKYLHSPDSETLYRLPDEGRNCAVDEQATRERLRRAELVEEGRHPAGAGGPAADDRSLREMLEALGYTE